MLSRLKQGDLLIFGRVTVVDAAVSGTWQLPDGTIIDQTYYTNDKGHVNFQTNDAGIGVYTLTISNIVKTGYTFDADNSLLAGTFELN